MLIYIDTDDIETDAICLRINGTKCDSLLKAAILTAGESIEGFSKDKLYDYIAYLSGEVTSNFEEALAKAVQQVEGKNGEG